MPCPKSSDALYVSSIKTAIYSVSLEHIELFMPRAQKNVIRVKKVRVISSVTLKVVNFLAINSQTKQLLLTLVRRLIGMY